MNETKERVTRKALEEMPIGGTCTFAAEGARGIESARVTATQMARIENVKYVCSANYADNTITITKSNA